MCMKNVNLTVTTADILGNKETKAISLGNIDRPYTYKTTDDNKRIVESISLVMFMQAVQSKEDDKIALINPNEKLLFSENYSIKIRLTESKSGKAIDLDEFVLCPEDAVYKECVCCDTFKFNRLCICDNIILPPAHDNEFFVIKILIKHLENNPEIDANKKWIVQTVYPITLTPDET